jgi:hypothetical protein
MFQVFRIAPHYLATFENGLWRETLGAVQAKHLGTSMVQKAGGLKKANENGGFVGAAGGI